MATEDGIEAPELPTTSSFTHVLVVDGNNGPMLATVDDAGTILVSEAGGGGEGDDIRLDAIELELQNARSPAATLELRIDPISTEITNARGATASLNARITPIETEVVNARTGAASLKARIDPIANEVTNARGTFPNLDARLDDIDLNALKAMEPPLPLFWDGKKLEVALYREEDERLIIGQDSTGAVVLPGVSATEGPVTPEAAASVDDDVYLREVGGVDQVIVSTGAGERQMTFGNVDWVGGRSANHPLHVIATLNGVAKRVSKVAGGLVRPAGNEFMDIWIVTGQSNAVGAEGTLVSTQALFPGYALMLNIGNPVWHREVGEGVPPLTVDNPPLPPGSITSLDDLIEGAGTYSFNLPKETLAAGYANSWLIRSQRYIGKLNKILFAVVGGAGKSYDDIKKGSSTTPIYANAMTAFEGACDLALASGMEPRFGGLICINGENNHNNIAGQTGATEEASRVAFRDTYEELRVDYRNDCFSRLAARNCPQTGEIELYLTQISSWSRVPPPNPEHVDSVIPWAQFEAGIRWPHVHCAGPKYQWEHGDNPLSDTAGAHILDQRAHGELIRHVAEIVEAGGEWYPIGPIASGVGAGATITGITRVGAIISVRYPQAVAIETNNARITDPNGDEGFEYSDSAGNTIIAVNVRAADPRFIDITLSSAGAATNRLLAYAYSGVLGNPGGPLTGPRGRVRSAAAYKTELKGNPTSLEGGSEYDWGVVWGRFPVP